MSVLKLTISLLLAALFAVGPGLAATGSWNGVAFTAWNAVAVTSWNGTSISTGGGTSGLEVRSTSTSVGTGTDITVSEPAGAQENDILLAVAECAGAGTLGAPSGWTVISSGSDAYDNFFEYNFAWIRRGASAPSLTWTTGSSVVREVRILCISGAITSGSPIEANSSAQGSASDPDPSTVTTITADALVVAMWVYGQNTSGDTAWVPPSGYTFQGDNTAGLNTGAATKIAPSPGEENPGVTDGANLSYNWRSLTAAVKPAP